MFIKNFKKEKKAFTLLELLISLVFRQTGHLVII